MIIQNQSQEPIRVSIRSWSIIIIHICIQAAIWYALDNYQYQDAVFLSERLHAESKYLCILFTVTLLYAHTLVNISRVLDILLSFIRTDINIII